MNVVWKYEVPITDRSVVKMKPGARIIAVAAQGKALCVWALVDPDAIGWEDRHLLIVGTGHEFAGADGIEYLGTAHFQQFGLVWHLFEEQSG